MKWFIGSSLVAALLFQSISWQQSVGQSTTPPVCTCQEGLSTTQLAGAYECQHGPESNADCRDLAAILKKANKKFNTTLMCKESNGGKNIIIQDPTTGQVFTFACRCYDCGLPDPNGVSNQCEPLVVNHEGICLPTTTNQGDCVRHPSHDNLPLTTKLSPDVLHEYATLRLYRWLH